MPQSNPAVVPIRTTERVGHRARTQEQTTVFCPERAASCDLDRCRHCERRLYVQVNDDPRTRVVRCQVSAPEIAGQTLRDIMSPYVCGMSGDLLLSEACRLLVEKGLTAVPVLDEAFKPVGMLSKTDLLLRQYEDLEEGVARASATVDEVMTSRVFTLPDTALVKDAAALMALERIHHLPVVDEDGRVVGIVTSLDLTRWIAAEGGAGPRPR